MLGILLKGQEYQTAGLATSWLIELAFFLTKVALLLMN